MTKSELVFDGIKRSGSDLNPGTGACDLVQNLRYEYGKFGISERKKEIFSDNSIVKAYRHSVGSAENIVCVRQMIAGTSLIDMYDNGSFKNITSYTVSPDRISVVTTGNLLVILADDYNLSSGRHTDVFIWKDGAYSVFSNGILPEMPSMSVKYGSNIELSYESTIVSGSDVSPKILMEYVQSHLNRARHIDSTYRTEGYVLISMDYTLFDGTRTKQTAPRMIRLSEAGFLLTSFKRGKNYKNIDIRTIVTVQSATVSLNVPSYFWNRYKDIIRSINVYVTYAKSSVSTDDTFLYDQLENIEAFCNSDAEGEDDYLYLKSGTKPVLSSSTEVTDLMTDRYGDVNQELLENYFTSIWNTAKQYTAPSVSELKLEDELMYQVYEIPVTEDISSMKKAFDIKFGEDILSGTRMEATPSGYINYFGKALSFNSRVHLYNLRNELTIDTGTLSSWGDGGSPSYSVVCIVSLKNDGDDITTYHTFSSSLPLIDSSSAVLGLSAFKSYPDSRAYKATFYVKMADGIYSGTLNLYPSLAYNYAYSFSAICNISKSQLTELPTANDANPFYNNPCDIVASERSNPLVYESSYRVNGEITVALPMSDAVSEAQFGQYPLALFTTDGIYVMQQGSGTVLYSNIVKINDIKCSSGIAISTKTGIYFHSEDGIYSLSGRNIKRISEVVEGECMESLLQSEDYKMCLDNVKIWTAGDQTAPVTLRSLLMSGTPVLSYDSVHDELIVSSLSIRGKSLVYGVKTGLWREDGIQSRFYGNGLAVVKYLDDNALTRRLCDMETLPECTEESKAKPYPVCILTRCIRLNAGYSTIHRLIARGLFLTEKYKLNSDGENVSSMMSLFVFTSDDLANWALEGVCQTDDNTDKIQIMKMGGSHKYHVIALAGFAKPGTEIHGFDIMCEERYGSKIR